MWKLFLNYLQPHHNKEEFARRGDEIYERDLRPIVEEGNEVKYVAIDIVWDGELRRKAVDCSEVDPLVGMSLLQRCESLIQVINDGTATIKPLHV